MIRNTDKEIEIATYPMPKQMQPKIIAEGEAEYMRILSNAYSDTSSEFYSFIGIDAPRESLSGSDKTLILSKDSPLAQIFCV